MEKTGRPLIVLVVVLVLDRKWLSNIKQQVKFEMTSATDEIFLGLKDFKRNCDKRDVFFVYKINAKDLNPDTPNYVFKTKVRTGSEMNQGSEHFLENQRYFFDWKVKKVQNYKLQITECLSPSVKEADSISNNRLRVRKYREY